MGKTDPNIANYCTECKQPIYKGEPSNVLPTMVGRTKVVLYYHPDCQEKKYNEKNR